MVLASRWCAYAGSRLVFLVLSHTQSQAAVESVPPGSLRNLVDGAGAGKFFRQLSPSVRPWPPHTLLAIHSPGAPRASLCPLFDCPAQLASWPVTLELTDATF